MPWLWDLVAMLSQILLCLPNLLTQPFKSDSRVGVKSFEDLDLKDLNPFFKGFERI